MTETDQVGDFKQNKSIFYTAFCTEIMVNIASCSVHKSGLFHKDQLAGQTDFT